MIVSDLLIFIVKYYFYNNFKFNMQTSYLARAIAQQLPKTGLNFVGTAIPAAQALNSLQRPFSTSNELSSKLPIFTNAEQNESTQRKFYPLPSNLNYLPTCAGQVLSKKIDESIAKTDVKLLAKLFQEILASKMVVFNTNLDAKKRAKAYITDTLKVCITGIKQNFTLDASILPTLSSHKADPKQFVVYLTGLDEANLAKVTNISLDAMMQANEETLKQNLSKIATDLNKLSIDEIVDLFKPSFGGAWPVVTNVEDQKHGNFSWDLELLMDNTQQNLFIKAVLNNDIKQLEKLTIMAQEVQARLTLMTVPQNNAKAIQTMHSSLMPASKKEKPENNALIVNSDLEKQLLIYLIRANQHAQSLGKKIGIANIGDGIRTLAAVFALITFMDIESILHPEILKALQEIWTQ